MTCIYISSVIGASAGQVWSTIRDFNALPDWHPLVSESHIEGGTPADQVGSVRALRLQDSDFIRERLLALSDYDYSYTYSILESPMGVENYIATLKLTPITDGCRTFTEWSAEFDCEPNQEAQLVERIGVGVFQAGFDSLKERFNE